MSAAAAVPTDNVARADPSIPDWSLFGVEEVEARFGTSSASGLTEAGARRRQSEYEPNTFGRGLVGEEGT